MLVFNEGVPGSGKSYDAVVSHILPALKSGRKVYARLNGLNHEKIAAYLSLPVDDVRALLVHVEPDQVHSLPVLADNDSLIVIDEAHTFFTASREPLPKDQETFFAEHRHKGQDILIISQWYKRLHSAVRARVERKAVFQKMTAVGLTNKYMRRHYHVVEPDKFEKVGGELLTYKSEIFPLYAGIRPDAANTAVYKSGGRNAIHVLAKRAVFVVPLVIFAVWFLHRTFTGTGGLTSHGVPSSAVAPERGQVRASAVPVFRPVPVPRPVSRPVPASVSYVLGLTASSRPRLAGVVSMPGRAALGMVEWIDGQGTVRDRLSLSQLRAMGLRVRVVSYGVLLGWRGHDTVVTSWPLPDTSAVAASAAPGAVGVPTATGLVSKAAGLVHGGPPVASTQWPASGIPQVYTPPQLTHVSALSGPRADLSSL